MTLNLYSDFMKNGIPESWTDSETMQNLYDSTIKYWRVQIAHKKTEYGIGVFSLESVTKGTVLRVGIDKDNVIVANGVDDLPLIDRKNLGGPIDQKTLDFITNYIYGWSYEDGVVETYRGFRNW